MSLDPGLYMVATPIGSADDITLRTLRILAEADVLAAEDTRTLRRLMEIHGLSLGGRPLIAYHDHNGPQVRPRLIAALAEGKSVAYAPEAGTPLIADPGFRLAAEAIAAGLPVTAAPGPSALLAALAVAGLPTDRFLFAGFLPPKQTARRRALAELSEVPASLVFYESPRRLAAALADMAGTLGPRDAAICRELTKKFEQVRRGGLADLAAALAGEEPPKGEVVVVVGPPVPGAPDAAALDDALRAALREHSVKDAAAEVAGRFGLKRRAVYARALDLKAGQ